ncbi:NADH oxidase [Mycoplasmopsis mucosicanis]|uniref:NADH oxidase n=1 Tax=Mycoplasmopsis mucosicanis TaxID=458208 RepID=A0A507SXX0_9BACT|nr:FAD-dependent oxidoreductase [Mycoplasmopsis mucosicanis]TQC53978.1 NADH oxidase [Mycoplasmopsis mucosicanis]
MKIILVGSNHAGTSFIRTLKTVIPDAEITAYERNTNTSFLGCGIAVWVAGEFDEPGGLFYSSPESLKNDYGVNLKVNHEVISIDKEKKEVTVLNLEDGSKFTDTYDKLVFAGGSWPIEPRVKGIEFKNVVLAKTYEHAKHLIEYANDPKIRDVAIVGAGYIGIELAEAFHIKGKRVTVYDIKSHIINRYFDDNFTSVLERKMASEGVKLALGQEVVEFKSQNNKDVSSIVTDKGEYKTDLAVICIGFRPRTEAMTELMKTTNGAIIVDKFQRSVSNSDVYAVGDACALKHSVTENNRNVTFATNAVKSGLVAALHIAGLNIPFPGVVGTNALNAFGCHYTSTGLTREVARANGFEDAESVTWTDMDRPEFMKSSEKVECSIVYSPKTLRILGAQIGSWGESVHTETIYMFALAIQQGLTIPELALTDVFFLPHFNKPFNFFLVPMLKALGLNYKR